MMKRQKGTNFYISAALISLVLLLIYYSYREYRLRALEFENQANLAFQLAIDKSEADRKQRVKELWLKDMEDPNLVKVKSEGDETGGLRISIINPKTNEKELTFHLMDIKNPDTVSADYIRKRLKELLISMGGDYVFFQDTLNARFQVYQDTVRTSEEELKRNFEDQLSAFGITSDFEVYFSSDSVSTIESTANSISIETIKMNKEDWSPYAYAYASFFSPKWEIFDDIKLILIINFFVLLFIILVFWQMLKIIKKQRQLVQLKDDFIDNVTHELLTPVSTLTVGIESLENYLEQGQTEKVRTYVAIAKQEVSRISNLVKGVLQSSMAYQGQVKLKIEAFELLPILESVRHYHLQKSTSALSITLKCPENLKVCLDKQHIVNVFHNLIDNALKYGNANETRIEIEAKMDDKNLEISIRDNGNGIPESDSERIFEKFHRVSQNDVHNVKGLGIGLYYVKTILQRMNGSIVLSQSSSEGSTFKISIDSTKNA